MENLLLRKRILLIAVLSLMMLCGLSALAQGVATTEPGKPAAAAQASGGNPTQASPGVSSDHNISSASLTPKAIEDWSTPSLKGSDLKPAEPLVGEIDVHDAEFTREITRVQWRPGDPVDLYIIKPAGIKKAPVILYLYSFPFETDRFHDNDFCKFLIKDGFAAVGFPSALTAARFRGRSMKEWFVSDLRESLATSAHDVQMILNYLATRGDMDMDRVGMFGDGSGASIAILAAAVDPRIKTLDLLNPWGDWPDWIAKSTRIPENERPGFLKPEFLAGVAPLDPIKWLPELKTQKVRLQEVKAVTVTPNEARLKIEAAAPSNVQVVRYEDEKAFVSAISGGTGFDWLKEHMQPGSTQPQYRANGNSQSQDSKAKESQP
jgi:hypothetical protein